MQLFVRSVPANENLITTVLEAGSIIFRAKARQSIDIAGPGLKAGVTWASRLKSTYQIWSALLTGVDCASR